MLAINPFTSILTCLVVPQVDILGIAGIFEHCRFIEGLCGIERVNAWARWFLVTDAENAAFVLIVPHSFASKVMVLDVLWIR